MHAKHVGLGAVLRYREGGDIRIILDVYIYVYIYGLDVPIWSRMGPGPCSWGVLSPDDRHLWDDIMGPAKSSRVTRMILHI